MAFEKGKSGNPNGRKTGSKNKSGNRENLVKLLDFIIEDMQENYHKLSNNQKIKLLSSFKGIYEDTALTQEEIDHFKTITVNVISNKNGDTEL